MSCKMDAQPVYRFTCGAQYARKSSNRKVHYCNMVAFILSHGRIRVQNVASVSDNNLISRNICVYIRMRSRLVRPDFNFTVFHFYAIVYFNRLCLLSAILQTTNHFGEYLISNKSILKNFPFSSPTRLLLRISLFSSQASFFF